MVDSTKLETDVSSDQYVQKSLHARHKAGHHLTITALCEANGTVVLFSTASISIDSRGGDTHEISLTLAEELHNKEKGLKANLGITTLLSGSDE